MIEFLIETITVVAPILGGLSAIAAIVQLAYKMKEVIYELQVKDEKFSSSLKHLHEKMTSIKSDIGNFLDLTQSRQESFESRLLEVERDHKELIKQTTRLADDIENH